LGRKEAHEVQECSMLKLFEIAHLELRHHFFFLHHDDVFKIPMRMHSILFFKT
jgi:hypothetical protein